MPSNDAPGYSINMIKELLRGGLKNMIKIKLISGRLVKVKGNDRYEYAEKMFVIRRKKGDKILIPYTSIERIEEKVAG
jgi:hypothetical protein